MKTKLYKNGYEAKSLRKNLSFFDSTGIHEQFDCSLVIIYRYLKIRQAMLGRILGELNWDTPLTSTHHSAIH